MVSCLWYCKTQQIFERKETMYYIHLIRWFNIKYVRIFCELRSIFLSPIGASENMSNEQNARSYYMLNHRIRDLLFHHSFVRFLRPFCRSSSVHIFALFYRVIRGIFCAFFFPNMVKWRNGGIIMTFNSTA